VGVKIVSVCGVMIKAVIERVLIQSICEVWCARGSCFNCSWSECRSNYVGGNIV